MSSGLNAAQRIRARDLAVQAAVLGLKNAPYLHYTEGPERWQGISRDLKAYRGQFPTEADCSAFVTWCLWNGLDHYGVPDIVNGDDWKGGYTGTLDSHGKPVGKITTCLRADVVLYGNVFGATGHTALIVGMRNGKPMVISNGSEAGPFYLPYDYRSDIHAIRRMIL